MLVSYNILFGESIDLKMVAWTLQEEEDDKALIFFVPIFLYLFQHVQLTAYGKRCVTIVPEAV